MAGSTDDGGGFTGEVAMVTGGGGDIGLATARRLAQQGARVVLLDVDQAKLDAAVTRLREEGPATVSGRVCDVTDAAAVDAVVGEVADELGPVRLLFNNAGYQGAFAQIHTYPADDFARVMAINVTGAFHVLRAASAQMVAGGGGAIVNTASVAGMRGTPNMAAYATSKAAIIGLTQTAAKDLAPFGIRVNAISPAYMGPGYMWTRQVELQAAAGSRYFASDPDEVSQAMIDSVPMRRYGSIEEIPRVVTFLLSDDASYVTGANIPISGGV